MQNTKKILNIDKESIRIVLILGLIALISALTLSLVFKYVVVDEEAVFRKKLSESYSSPLTDKDISLAGYQDMNDTVIEAVYEAEDGAVVISSHSKKAYNAAGITLIVIMKDGVIKKIAVNSATETPGVGSKALTPEYLSKFEGSNVDDFHIGSDAPAIEAPSSGGVNVKYITGATKTSTGVQSAVKAAVKVYQFLQDEERIDG